MTNATTTQTPEPTPADIDALNAGIKSAQEALAALKAKMAADGATLMAEATKSGDYSALTARGDEIKSAERAVAVATAKLDEASRNSRWENLAEARKPIVDALSELIRDAKPTAAVTAVKGVAKVNDDGSVTVSLTPTVEKLEMAEIEKAIAATFDGAAFKSTNVTSIEIAVTDIGKSNAAVRIVPTANVSLQFRNKPTGDGTRAGALTYDYNGTAMGAKDFLLAVHASGNAYLTDKRAKSYDTAINGNGNGLSNLAKDTAKELGITPTEAAPSA